MSLHDWARRWGVSAEALRDLQATLGTWAAPLPPGSTATGKSESWAQNEVRLEASERGVAMFRNNVGALKDERGRVVRFGLANDSAALNDVIKSGDLIGVRPVVITPAHVGQTIGQFVSREIKAPGWQYSGTGREPAQLAWAALINSKGGDAAFATGRGTI